MQAQPSTVARAARRLPQASASRRAAQQAQVPLVVARHLVFLEPRAWCFAARAAAQGLARLVRQVARLARSLTRLALQAETVSVAVAAVAPRSVTAAWAARLQLLERLLRQLHMVAVAVVAVKTLRAVLDGREPSSLSGLLNVEGDLSEMPSLRGHSRRCRMASPLS